jgi:hypothetical protein
MELGSADEQKPVKEGTVKHGAVQRITLSVVGMD